MQTDDGVELAVYERGDPDGLPLVLCNGLGGGVLAWREVVRRLGPGVRTIGWDYRGTYGSAPAARADDYRVERHAQDLACVLRALGVEEPVLAGWSMGVQVALEWCHAVPGRARALVFLHGAAGTPVRSAFDSPWSATLAPSVLAALRLVGSSLAGPGPGLARSRWVSGGFCWIGRRLGVMAESLDVAFFSEVAEEWTRLDLAAYADLFEHLDRHDASHALPGIESPALVVSGGRDRFTPPHLAESLAARLRDARLVTIPHATHFGLLEAPAVIARHVREFLAELPGSGLHPRGIEEPVRGAQTTPAEIDLDRESA